MVSVLVVGGASDSRASTRILADTTGTFDICDVVPGVQPKEGYARRGRPRGSRESSAILLSEKRSEISAGLHLRGSGARRGVARRARKQQELGEARGQPLLSVGGSSSHGLHREPAGGRSR